MDEQIELLQKEVSLVYSPFEELCTSSITVSQYILTYLTSWLVENVLAVVHFIVTNFQLKSNTFGVISNQLDKFVKLGSKCILKRLG